MIKTQNNFNKLSSRVKKVATFFILLFIIVLCIGLPQINITDYVQSTITSKFIVFALACLVIIGGGVALFVFSKLRTIQISKLDIILLFIIGYMSLNRYVIQSDYGFSIRYLELLGLSVVYVVLRIISYKNYIGILLAIVISGIIQAIYGNLQLFGYYGSNHSGFKLTGSFFNPGPYAGFLAAVWPITLGMYLFKEKIIEQVGPQIKGASKITKAILSSVFEYIPLLGIISVILVIPATHSRGAWLAVLISSLVLTEFRYHFIKHGIKKLNHIKKIALTILVLSVFFTGLLGVYHFKKGSSDGRLFIWKVSTEIIKDFPLTGVGFDKFKAHYMNYQAGYFVKHGETSEALVADNTYYAFNEWLQFVTENGLIGFLILVILMYTLLKIQVADKNRNLLLIIRGTLLSISVFALFSYPMQILPIKFVIIIGLSLMASLDIQKYTVFNRNKNSTPYKLLGLKTIALVFGILGILKGVTYIETLDSAFKTWKNGLTIYQYGDYQGAVDEYAKAYPILKKDGDFLMNYGKGLAMNKQNKEAAQVLEIAKQYLNTTIIETALGDAYKGVKQYNEAEMAYQDAANMIPIRFYPLYLQAKLFEESGENEKAVAIAKNILNKEIKVPSTAIKEIQAEMKRVIENNK
ncbi:O-antigen ligase family protein [Flavivirga spongiicola]|uniref:O-antigen ligase family protein n=1 Tax=Flavivirga spongiicola TaxID=421621 RepID=A0ABU7XMC4_9FLAO|nr:O-antigen ligase family protein [Flavivirga sp. MEBiC05379]MDO5981569.1 O-antigen ligase family protein [Flavivirga sp. MEBiC05379]